MSRAPDLIGEIVGYRGWGIEQGWRRIELVSLHHFGIPFAWPGDDWTRAECHRDCGETPGPCGCGIYAAKDRGHLHRIRYMGDHSEVYGEVGLAGRVIPGTLGWRAERARPLRLWVPHDRWEWVRPLRDRYRIPVLLTNPFERSG